MTGLPVLRELNTKPPPFIVIVMPDGRRLATAWTPLSSHLRADCVIVSAVALLKLPRSVRTVVPPVSVTEPVMLWGELMVNALLPSRTKLTTPAPVPPRLPGQMYEALGAMLPGVGAVV